MRKVDACLGLGNSVRKLKAGVRGRRDIQQECCLNKVQR